MGIDISSKLIVGLPYDELVEGFDEDRQELLNEMLDDGELDYASPYFDSPRDEWIVGFSVTPHGDDLEILYDEMIDASRSFISEYSIIPRVYCIPHVY